MVKVNWDGDTNRIQEQSSIGESMSSLLVTSAMLGTARHDTHTYTTMMLTFTTMSDREPKSLRWSYNCEPKGWAAAHSLRTARHGSEVCCRHWINWRHDPPSRWCTTCSGVRWGLWPAYWTFGQADGRDGIKQKGEKPSEIQYNTIHLYTYICIMHITYQENTKQEKRDSWIAQ